MWWVTNRTFKWKIFKETFSNKIPSSVPKLPLSNQWASTLNKTSQSLPKISKHFLLSLSVKKTQTVNNYTKKTERNFQCWHFWKIKDNRHEEILLFIKSYIKLITIYFFFLSIHFTWLMTKFNKKRRYEMTDKRKILVRIL